MASKVKANTVALKNSIWSLADIDKAIASISKRGQALKDYAHETLVHTIDHYIANGDYTRLPKLLIAVKTSIGGSQAQAMAEWVQRYVSSLSYSEDAKKEQAKGPADKNMLGFVHMPKVEKKVAENVTRIEGTGKTARTVVYASAREIPFYDLERNVEIKPFDLLAALDGVIKRAHKALEQMHDKEYEGPKHVINDDQVALLDAMKEQIEKAKAARKAQRPATASKKSDVTPSAGAGRKTPVVETSTTEETNA
jgi:hypothetical protein